MTIDELKAVNPCPCCGGIFYGTVEGDLNKEILALVEAAHPDNSLRLLGGSGNPHFEWRQEWAAKVAGAAAVFNTKMASL